jgi:3-deoxy-manno-octulosonate cytidylyltransferase (CMP-KDO synthetase)
MLRALGVIPARFASTRFRGKPLAPLGDRTMIEHVWRRARSASRLEAVVVATDDARIADHCRGFGAEVRMTSPDHPSGTDRVAEVARGWNGTSEVIVNLQGDEPMVTGSALDRLIASFDVEPRPDIATLSEPIESIDAVFDPNVVKVVTGADGRALYFSRSPIPFLRVPGATTLADLRTVLSERPEELARFRKHQGIYAYRRDVLEVLTALPPSALEQAEGLEQLRALEAGHEIRVLPSDFRSVGVDTPADLERVAALLTSDRMTPNPSATKEPDR